MALGLVIAVALAFASPANAAVQINIDKSTQKMDVLVDGVPTYHWNVSTGLAGYDTPSGSYTPFRMEADHYSRQYDDAPMPHSIFFTHQGHAIHGTMDQRYMGRAASHGCVRLMPANAAVLYDLVKEQGMTNTSVSIYGTIPGGPGGQQMADQDRRRQGPGWFSFGDPRSSQPAYAPANQDYQVYNSRAERRAARRAARRARN
ncbi:L,D-transpeptidase [Methyloligella sp. GL2]|nr:L,D-transpeptidase [Methyloligella sp. GL2]QKP78844.1 L,D-transpeptidase [Methyloligella sp. GL2]